MNRSLYILQILFLRFERNTLSPILVQCQAPGRCWFYKREIWFRGQNKSKLHFPQFWCSSSRKNLLSQAFLASLWWVQVKIVLTVKTLYIQEGYKCLILAEGAQKVGEFSCYFSNPPAQRLTTLVSHSEANPKNNWMRGEQACLGCRAILPVPWLHIVKNDISQYFACKTTHKS